MAREDRCSVTEAREIGNSQLLKSDERVTKAWRELVVSGYDKGEGRGESAEKRCVVR